MIQFSQGGFPSRRNHYLGTASGADNFRAVLDFGTHTPSRPPWDLGWGLGFGVWGGVWGLGLAVFFGKTVSSRLGLRTEISARYYRQTTRTDVPHLFCFHDKCEKSDKL